MVRCQDSDGTLVEMILDGFECLHEQSDLTFWCPRRPIGPYLNQYAGQPLTTGAQAEAYADHFIAVRLSEMPYGGMYSAVSAASRANPSNAKLAAEVQTSFQGTPLRGLLLEPYSFSEFALIALWGTFEGRDTLAQNWAMVSPLVAASAVSFGMVSWALLEAPLVLVPLVAAAQAVHCP